MKKKRIDDNIIDIVRPADDGDGAGSGGGLLRNKIGIVEYQRQAVHVIADARRGIAAPRASDHAADRRATFVGRKSAARRGRQHRH
ncbi:hypothetical protein [Mesorhizobium sp. ES1-3]|uniref:hypothetical protein n=1 Tax=Mesorhizobium sp. ES1-3 TaxID=2876628 RepID=UPI001CCE4476|nr:hypothetical protein [Mesorhizobium sp. ES1-3]